MTGAGAPFVKEHAGSLAGSVALHLLLIAAVIVLGSLTPPVRHVVPAVMEASLVTPSARRYVTPETAPPTPVEPTKAPEPPAPAVKPQPAPAAKTPPVSARVPPGVTQPAKSKAEVKAKPEAKPKPAAPIPKERVLSKTAATALERELQETERANERARERAQQEAAKARLEAQARADAQAKQKADAQRQAQMAGETSQYLAEVKARVERAWNRPASARKGIQCTLEVDQAPTGTVLQARVINPCNGDEALRASIRDAALRASPLPVPKNADVFQRTLHLVFSPDE